jgi:hypothetical protein
MRHRIVRLSRVSADYLGGMLLRTVLSMAVFLACVIAAMKYMGIPIPDLSDVVDKVPVISSLARLLS